ncbi:MAG: hypothetical protein IPF94_06465 [Betaproteobacteria bacterium]|nr:hypothetical protein [Betaproteobacteria bacterium]
MSLYTTRLKTLLWPGLLAGVIGLLTSAALAQRGPFDEAAPVQIGNAPAGATPARPSPLAPLLDAALAAMPGTPDANANRTCNTCRWTHLDEGNLFVVSIDYDMPLWRRQLAERSDTDSVFQRWDGRDVLQTVYSNRANTLRWTWLEGGLRVSVEFRGYQEAGPHAGSVARIADAMHRAAANLPGAAAATAQQPAPPSPESATVPPAAATESPKAATSAPGESVIQLPDGWPLPLPGLGRIGYVPGPATPLQGIVGVLAPGAIAVLGGLLSGLFGSPVPAKGRNVAATETVPEQPMANPPAESTPAADANPGAAQAEADASARAEWLRQRQEDLKQIRESQAFIAANAAGARQGGFDATEHDRQIRDLQIREKEVAGQIAAAGGDTAYVARAREVIPVGDGFVEALRIAQERDRQAALATARARMDELLKAQQAADRDYWNEVKEGFWGGVVSDVDAIPGQLKDAAKAGLRTIGETVGAAADALEDTRNWRDLGQAVIQTAADLVGSPLQSARKVGGFYGEVAGTAAQVGVHIATHPVDTLKAIAGVDNWEKAMDPNVPVTERIGRVLVGIADAAVAIGGAGLVTQGARTADAVVDAAKVADKLGDSLSGVDKLRHAAWEEAQALGKIKVDEFDQARRAAREAAKTGDAAMQAAAEARLRKATLEVQGDKQALWDINKGSRPNDLKKAFNGEMGAIYKETDERVVRVVCRQNGIDFRRLREQPPGSGIYYNELTGRPDIVVVKPTNPVATTRVNARGEVEFIKPVEKVGADRDVTVRVRRFGDQLVADPAHPGQFIRAGEHGVLTDLPSGGLSKTYNRAFYKTAGGKVHGGDLTPKQFADKMDQVATDRLHAEAYGRGQKDLQVAISQPGAAFSDAEQVAKAAQYKSEHLYKQAHDLAAKGQFKEAETALGEGMRQATKQFDRQVLGRVEALRAQGVQVAVPQDLLQHMATMKQAQASGWSPARVAEALRRRGTTVEAVTQRSAGLLESMQKLRPR